ncbi:MAG TPA: GNAT family N-acetyltransferase [Pseudolabrys sp.]|nr:GNAT family N-acetyltransferase [Pseudolabrys sp.]
MTDIELRIAQSLAEVPAAAWDACAAGSDLANGSPALAPAVKLTSEDNLSPDLATRGQVDNPFITHNFLSSLEASNSVGGRTGWQPRHLLAEGADGALLGAAPCYVKTHSRGEYVFDHGWAEAFEHAGGDYYPKLQVAVPFTPVTGPRLLARSGPLAQVVRGALGDALTEITTASDLSSAHVTFLTEPEWRALGERGFLLRNDQQFHWDNEGYANFDDFLGRLASRKRKAIRRERKEALSHGIEVEWLSGAGLTEAVWDAFFAFYMETGSRKWGRPYLTREFFSIVGEKMGDRILLVMAKRAGRWIGGALNFLGHDAIFGRNWGAVEHHPFLHFELCYYQAIDYAIAHKLKRVEAGAQGEHKLARGYLPRATYSAHFIANPGLRRAIADYLARERAYVRAAGEELAALAPFRKDLVEQE